MKFVATLTSIVISLFSFCAHAGYLEALEAIKSDDPEKAFQLLVQAAKENDARAYFTLGMFYEFGAGTAKDEQAAINYYKLAAEAGDSRAWKKLAIKLLPRKGIGEGPAMALYWANLSAKSGDAEGQFLVYQIVRITDMNFIGSNGRPDQNKYDALAKRQVKHRYKDKLAYEMLYRSAQKKYMPAMVMQAAVYGDNIGIENRKKFVESSLLLVDSKGFKESQRIKNLIDIASQIDSLGESLVTNKIWLDVMTPVFTSAALEVGITSTPDESCKSRPWKVTKVQISKPLTGAEYLPTDIPELVSTFLLGGEWEETWEIDLCGKSVTVPIVFNADGMGGAKFRISSSKKKAPEISE